MPPFKPTNLFFFIFLFSFSQGSTLSDILNEPEPKDFEHYWMSRMKLFRTLLEKVPEWVVKDITIAHSSADLVDIAMKDFPPVVQAYFSGKNLLDLLISAYATPFSSVFRLEELGMKEFNESVTQIFAKVFDNLENFDIQNVSKELEVIYERSLISPKSEYSTNRAEEINKNLRKLKLIVEQKVSDEEKSKELDPKIKSQTGHPLREKLRKLFISVKNNLENVDKFFGSFILARKSGESKLLNAMVHMILLAETSIESISNDTELSTAQKKFETFAMVYRRVLEYNDIDCAMDKLISVKKYATKAYERSKQFYGMKKEIFQKAFFMAAAGEIDFQIHKLKKSFEKSGALF